jgi:ABC-type Mn2+/Zn2+ transport system permease subunit
MFDWSVDLWTITVGIAVNACCAILGCYLVLRRMSLLGDAVSHSILAGIAGAFLLSGSIGPVPMFFGALAVGLLTAFLTQSLTTLGKVPEDSSMGVVFTSLFAVGVILISSPALRKSHLDDCVLIGLLDVVSLDTEQIAGWKIPRTLLGLGPMLVATLLFVFVFWKELKISSFDPELATSMGINAALMHYLLMGMVASTTVASMQAVGAILVIAMLIVPAATAHMLTDRLGWMIALAVLAGTTAAIFGCLWARWANSNAAGMMAVVAGLQFAVAVVLAPRYGLVSKAAHNARLAMRIVCEDIVATMYRWEESADRMPQPAADCIRAAGGGVLAKLAVPLLRRRGELTQLPDGTLALSEQGRRRGESLVRSHRLWESYLDQYFDLPADHLHEPAEQIEHFIGPELQSQLADSLQRPATDPHGRTIPPEPPPPASR